MLTLSPSSDLSFEEPRFQNSNKCISDVSRNSIPRRYHGLHKIVHGGQQVCDHPLSMDCRLETVFEDITEQNILPHGESGREIPLLNSSQHSKLVDVNGLTGRPRARKSPQSANITHSSSSLWKLDLWTAKHQYKYRRLSRQGEDDPKVQSNSEHNRTGAFPTDRQTKVKDRNVIPSVREEGIAIDETGLADDRERAYDNRSIVDSAVVPRGYDESFHRERSINEPLLEINWRKASLELAREDRNSSPSSSAGRTEKMTNASADDYDGRDPPPSDDVSLQSSRGSILPSGKPELCFTSFNKREINEFASADGIGGNVLSNDIKTIQESENAILDLSAVSDGEESISTVESVDERPLLNLRTIVCGCRSTKCRRKYVSKNSKDEAYSLIESGQQRRIRFFFPRKYESVDEITETPSMMTVDVPIEDHSCMMFHDADERQADLDELDPSCMVFHDAGERQADLDELDALIYKIAQMDHCRIPVESQLSAIAEGDEDVTQVKSTMSFKTSSNSTISKTQKLAQYLKRDGEATFDYVGTMYFTANSMESLARSKEEGIDDIELFAHMETITPSIVPRRKDVSDWMEIPPCEFPAKIDSENQKREDQFEGEGEKKNDENGKKRRRRNRTVVLKDDEIVVPIASEDASLDMSDITEEMTQIPENSALYKLATKIKDAERKLAEAQEREESSQIKPTNDVLDIDNDDSWPNDLKHIASVQF